MVTSVHKGIAVESAAEASARNAVGHTHTGGIVVDSACRKIPRFSEGSDLPGNDTFLMGALLVMYCFINLCKLSGLKQHKFTTS